MPWGKLEGKITGYDVASCYIVTSISFRRHFVRSRASRARKPLASFKLSIE